MRQHQIEALASRLMQHAGSEAFEEVALDQVRRACGADKAAMMYHGRSGPESKILLAPFLTAGEMRTYQGEFARLNPMIAPSRTLPIGRATSSLRFWPLRSYRRHPYFEWARSTFSPIEFAVVVSRSPTDAVLMTFARPERRGDATTRQLQALEACVAPFRRAHLLHRRLRIHDDVRSAADSTLLDLVDPHYACIALCADMTVVDVNANAEAMLTDASLVRLSGERMEFADSRVQRNFTAALRAEPDRPSLEFPEVGHAGTRVTVVDARHTHVPGSRGRKARWLVFLRVPEEALVERRVRAFSIRNGLTDVEEQVVRLLVSGQSAMETSQALSQSLSTTRSHIKRIFQKSGIHRQSLLATRVLLQDPT